MKKIYLDYAATTPLDPQVLRAMQPYFLDVFGNPSSLHHFGQQAISAVDTSREAIAAALKADFREIIFTGSATESNNIALRGPTRTFLRGLTRANTRGNFGVRSRPVRPLRRSYSEASKSPRPRFIISAVEHESVRETARDLEREGVEVVEIPVDQWGFVNLKKLEAALNERTVLVSMIYANNEIGTMQPLLKIAQLLSDFKKRIFNFQFSISKKTPELEIRNWKLGGVYPLFHTDATQAFQFLPCIPSELGVDLMTLSAHKIYGPKGIGLLYRRISNSQLPISKKNLITNPQSLNPIITGGGQEFGLRSGTENVPSMVGFAKAVELVCSARDQERVRITKLRDYFWNKLRIICPRAELTVPCIGDESESSRKAEFLPNILNVYFPGQSAEHLITKLDILGVAVSSGSACHTRASQPSHVIEALGFSRERTLQSIRFSFGRPTTKSVLDAALKKIKMVFI